MLFVCLAHFTNSYFFLNGEEGIGRNLVVIGMIASPTFVTMSGLVAGFLGITRKSSFVHLRRKLIDRGLFLLLVGHLVLSLSGLIAGQRFLYAYRIGYITDAIGFAILIGPWLVATFSGRARLLLAATVFILDWLAVLLWTPGEGIPSLVKAYIVGVVGPGQWELTAGDFAAIPWTAVYLIGTVIGTTVGSYYVSDRRKAAHLMLAKLGTVSILAALVTKVSLVILKRFAPAFAEGHQTLLHFLSFYQKFPPGPVYLCFFGGAGMLLVAAILEASRREIQPFLLDQLRQVGLASFFVYIVQFYIYVIVEHALHLPYTPFWPLIFVLSIVLIALAATLWNRKAGNQYLTVGIAPLLERAAHRQRTILEKSVPLETPAA